MSINNFLNKENIRTLWDVISDEDIFKYLPKNDTNNVLQIFEKNLKGFYESERTKIGDLITLNKKYILLMLNYIKSNYQVKQPVKIKIHDEINTQPEKELITYEEIQNNRKTEFERDLNKRQEEFMNAITLQVPPVPEFGDKYEDKPITEMEKMIQEMTTQRNYEVENINRNFNNSQNDADKWLKSQETSVKSEKLQQYTHKPSIEIVDTNNKLKYIKIDKDEITLNNPIEQKKNVTWGDNQTKEFFNEEDDKILEDSIFSKLKKTTSIRDNMNNMNTIKNNTSKSYVDRIEILEERYKSLNDKMDTIIDLLKQNK